MVWDWLPPTSLPWQLAQQPGLGLPTDSPTCSPPHVMLVVVMPFGCVQESPLLSKLGVAEAGADKGHRMEGKAIRNVPKTPRRGSCGMGGPRSRI